MIDVSNGTNKGNGNAQKSERSTFIYDATNETFIAVADAPESDYAWEDGFRKLLDDDGMLFAYVDIHGALWLIDDMIENTGSYADQSPDDWIYQGDT